MSENWIFLQSLKFPGKCCECNTTIEKGEPAFWDKDSKTVKHEVCPEVKEEPQTPVVADEDFSKWKDPTPKPFVDLEGITHCQKCGGELDPIRDDDYTYTDIEGGYRVCKKCFGTI